MENKSLGIGKRGGEFSDAGEAAMDIRIEWQIGIGVGFILRCMFGDCALWECCRIASAMRRLFLRSFERIPERDGSHLAMLIHARGELRAGRQ